MIRASRIANKSLYLVLLLTALSFYGCGSTESEAEDPIAGAGASVAVGATPLAGASGASGAESANAEGTEELATFPVRIGLRDGKFTPGTERQIAIIDGVALQFEFDVRDDLDYEIEVTDNSGGEFEPFRFDSRGDFETILDPLKPNQTLVLTLGDEQVEVTADFEPGP